MYERLITFVVAICFLAILSVIDIKTFNTKKGGIPAILTTMFLIVMFIINGISSIPSILFGSLIALSLIDLRVFHGIADLKTFIATALTFPTMLNILYFTVIMILVGIFYRMVLVRKFKEKKIKEIPFIPAIFIAYLIGYALFVL